MSTDRREGLKFCGGSSDERAVGASSVQIGPRCMSAEIVFRHEYRGNLFLSRLKLSCTVGIAYCQNKVVEVSPSRQKGVKKHQAQEKRTARARSEAGPAFEQQGHTGQEWRMRSIVASHHQVRRKKNEPCHVKQYLLEIIRISTELFHDGQRVPSYHSVGNICRN